MKPLSELSYLQRSWLLIIFFTSARIILSNIADLGNDESYYWTYSQHLQWNYFDHPPIVAIWIRIFTFNLWLQDYVFFIRLGSLVGCALSSYFMYKAITKISTARAGFIGVFLYNTSFYASITAGLFIMPDTPQMVFWTFSMYMIAKILEDEKKWIPWILFGVSSGLCVMSKVHGVFLWAGLFFYAVWYARKWFLMPHFYTALLLTIIISSPILLWNIQNDFITYRYHSRRVSIIESNLHWFGLLKEIIGQLIVNNPINIILVIWFVFFKKRETGNILPLKIYKLIALPLLIVILCIALFRQALPHWSGPAYITLLPIAAIGLSRVSLTWYKRTIKWLVTYTLLFIIIIAGAIKFYPGTFGNKSERNLGNGDISLDAFGWKDAGQEFAEIYKRRVEARLTPDKAPLICNSWWGAHEEYFFARPLKINMIGLGTLNDLHNYKWKNRKVLETTKMDTVFCIIPSDELYDVRKAYAEYYTTIDSVTTIVTFRNKKPAHKFYVYQLSGWKN